MTAKLISEDTDGATGSSVRCTLCGGSDTRLEFEKADHRYHRCRRCGHVFVYPLPDPAREAAYYANAYPSDYFQRERLWLEELARRRMDIVDSLFRGSAGRLLDAGCGFGLFMDQARRRGWRVHGIDAAKGPLRHARQELNLEPLEADIEPGLLSQPDGSMDLITFWHVLEHLPRPGLALRVAARKLAPGGLLIVNSPNLNSAIYKLTGKHWSWIYTPGHLQYFSPGSLRRCVERLGLKTVSEETWTDAPNLFFLLEEALLLWLCDLMKAWAKVGGRMWVRQERLRTWVYKPAHQQRVQMTLKAWYGRTPWLDGFLKRRNLGHEFFLVAARSKASTDPVLPKLKRASVPSEVA